MALWPNGKTYPGNVWHEYGPRKPIHTRNGVTSSFHSGIDIGPWERGATRLLSPVDGEVTHAGYDSIFGNRVVITSGNVQFWLCHGKTGSIAVSVGDRVSQGEAVMVMGETGKASGIHIHFEVHVNGKRVNPRDYYAGKYDSQTGGNSANETEDDEMVGFYVNVKGEAGKRRGGSYAVMRSNAGSLFARFVSSTHVAGIPVIEDARALKDWDATFGSMPGIK